MQIKLEGKQLQYLVYPVLIGLIYFYFEEVIAIVNLPTLAFFTIGLTIKIVANLKLDIGVLEFVAGIINPLLSALSIYFICLLLILGWGFLFSEGRLPFQWIIALSALGLLVKITFGEFLKDIKSKKKTKQNKKCA